MGQGAFEQEDGTVAKFVARQAVDMTDLDALDFLTDPLNADFSERERDGFHAESGDLEMEVDGSGFRYALDVPLPVGTITRLAVFESGSAFYKMTGIRIDLDQFTGASNTERIVLQIYSDDDKIKGSTGDDVLIAGKGEDRLFGQDGDDKLFGQKGRDQLDGGEGTDRLNGGGGKDVYVFSDTPGDGIDQIVDFQSGETLRLSSKAFAGLVPGQLPADDFIEGTEAADGGDRIIFDIATGALFFDPDGAGGAGQVQFATVAGQRDAFGAASIIVA